MATYNINIIMYNVVIIVGYCSSLSFTITCSAVKLTLAVCVTGGVFESGLTRVGCYRSRTTQRCAIVIASRETLIISLLSAITTLRPRNVISAFLNACSKILLDLRDTGLTNKP